MYIVRLYDLKGKCYNTQPVDTPMTGLTWLGKYSDACGGFNWDRADCVNENNDVQWETKIS